MVLVNELKGRIVAKGLTQGEVAKMLGISNKTFSTKLNTGIFTTVEIEKLIDILDLKNPWEIFFAEKVTY